ncbi:MAG: hypothetical protein EP330_29975 [Deltaproteobacteria bacterium]|nr:MAG: hypothetical protein EP330_29975 [Deltaproteobacteria bacterium]
MRFLCLLSLASLVGCATEGTSFDYQSTLSRNTRGLVLHEDGSKGHAGMLGTNCPFETEQGTVTGDYQLPDEGEKVVDSGDLIGEDTVLLLLGDDAHLLDKSTGEYTHETLTFANLVDARLFTGGMAALTEDLGSCRLEWSDGQTSESPCGELDVDIVTGTAMVRHPRGVSLLDAEGARVIAEPTAHAVLDSVAAAVYVADGQVVRGLDHDGTVRWETPVDGEVLALSEAGATGAAAVFVGFDDGLGELLYLDGDTGAVQARVGTPGWADELTVSADGSTVALVRPSETHFYRLSGEWRE